MPTVAFLGLGHMGAPMASRLAATVANSRSSYDHLTRSSDDGLIGSTDDRIDEMIVWNRTRAKAEAASGARVADSPGAAAAGVEIVLTMLANPAAVESVVFGRDGVAGSIRPGSVLVEMSTIGPDAVARLAERLPEGVGLVAAPVGGSVGAAKAGTLTVFAGGAEADVDRVAPVLAELGTVLRCGDAGTAAAAKLVVNTGLIAGLALLGELRALGGQLAVPTELTERLLAAGPLAALVERAKGTGAHFTVELAAKDLQLATEHATGIPITQAALGVVRAALPSDNDISEIGEP